MIAKLIADNWTDIGTTTSERIVRLVTKAILVLAFGQIAYHFLISAANPESYAGSWHITTVKLICAVLLIYMLTRGWGDTRQRGSVWAYLIWLLVYVALLPFALLYLTLGDNQIDTILIFLEHNSVGDATMVAHDGFQAYLKNQFMVFAALCVCALVLSMRLTNASKALLGFAALALFASPLTSYVAQKVIPNKLHTAFDPSHEVRAPVIVAKPETPMNLITIYLESLEQTYDQIAQTKPLMAPLTTLANRGFQARNLRQTVGGDTTIAGMVSTQCGVPLLPHGLNNVFYQYNQDSIKSIAFMPNVTCLGDLLAADGYTQAYMNGASLDAFGKRDFWTEHGGAQLFGLKDVPPAELANDRNFWGMNDDYLLDRATQKLRQLQTAGKPFALSLLTLATHGPDGFSSPKCDPHLPVESSMARAIACTAQNVSQFIATAEQNGLLDNTLVVILSDHLAYDNAFDTPLRANQDARRNLFFIHGGQTAQVNTRAGLTIDIYPTILTALGYQLDQGRANLGVALQTDTPNLSARFATPDAISKLFKGNRSLAAYLWRQ